MLRKGASRLGSTNRYTDGSGRKLDGNKLPKDLFLETISNRAYPSRVENWQVAVAGEPSPWKGKVVISGAGVVGLTAASLFSTRGWHVTVVEERSNPINATSTSFPSHRPPVHRQRCALLTKRAADALGYAGVTMDELRGLGVKVRGAMDHPGAFNSWLTRNLTEHHPFAVNMISVDVNRLRNVLEQQLHALPSRNCCIFYDHEIEAVHPQSQTLLVRQLRDFDQPGWPQKQQPVSSLGGGGTVETTLTMSPFRAEEVQARGVEYDLLVCAEGANSRLRHMMDVEGYAADEEFCVAWYRVKSKTLSREHIHRWLHKRSTRVANMAAINSAAHTPLCIAFPCTEAEEFALMAYFPRCELERLTGEELLRTFCPDAGALSVECVSGAPDPFPTVHCEELFNSVGLPSAVMVGGAAHTCNPFLMQGLAMGLEDCTVLLNHVDALNRQFYDAVRQYSRERGAAGDALREVTERCLFYERKKHHHPMLRFRNWTMAVLHRIVPRSYNRQFDMQSQNHFFCRSIEAMLNGRGYTSYDQVDKQQNRHMQPWNFPRVYT